MFDPEPYASNIRRLNQIETEKRRLRLKEAKKEASRLAQEILKSDSSVRAVYLFGSTATGMVSSLDFDIDLAIEGGNLFAALDITDASQFDVDLVDLDRLPEGTQRSIRSTGIKFS